MIIPTKDRPSLLAGSLDAVLAAARLVSGEPVEIIVVDDGDDPRVARLVAELDGRGGTPVQYVARHEYGGRGPGDARNEGVLRARGDLVAFTDDDTRCREDWLARGIARLRADRTIAGVEGAVVPVPAGPVDAARARVVHNLQGGAFLTANLFVRRDAVLGAGGFQRLWPGGWAAFREDTDLALRVCEGQGRIPFDPDLAVLHPIEHVSLRAHLRTAAFFLLDEPFRRLHPAAIPGVLEAPAARLRVRAACVLVLALPLLGSTRLRPIAAVAIAATTAAQHVQVERDLRLAAQRRTAAAMLRDGVRRAGRNLAWSVVAGIARGAGMVAVRTGVIAPRATPAPLADRAPAPAVLGRAD